MNFSLDGTATNLGVIRACVCGTFLIDCLLTSFADVGRLPTTIMHPPGIMEYLSWKFYDRLITPQGMTVLQVALAISLLLGTLGIFTNAATKAAAGLVILHQGILRSFGHFNHSEMVGVLCLVVLAASPCGDGFSFQTRNSSSNNRSFIYGYPVVLMQLILAWAYCTAGILKLRLAGFNLLDPDYLPVLAVQHSLDNLHDTQFQLGLHLHKFRGILPVGVFCVLAWEMLFPLAVFVPRLKWFFLGFGVLFHLSTMLLMNIIFVNQLAMYCVFVDWDRVLRLLASRGSHVSSNPSQAH